MGSQLTLRSHLFLLLILVWLTGCGAPQTIAAIMTETTQPTITHTATESRQFVLSPQPKVPTIAGTSPLLLYDEWPPEGFPNDAAHIIAVRLEKDILKIQVTYQGGCQEHIFERYAATAFLQSLPPQGLLHLSHDSHGDACTETIEKPLSFDLMPLNTERNDPSERPLLLRIYEPVGGSFAKEPYMPLIEWP